MNSIERGFFLILCMSVSYPLFYFLLFFMDYYEFPINSKIALVAAIVMANLCLHDFSEHFLKDKKEQV
jgi:hypothetical protein